MKILYVDQFSEIGGAQKCMLDLIPAFQARGWQIHAAIPGTGPLVGHLRSAKVKVETIPSGPYRSGWKRIFDTGRFLFDRNQQAEIINQLTATGSFDLVYVNGPRVLAGAVKGAHRTPVLFHAHNHVRPSYALRLTGRCLAAARVETVACCESVAATLRPFVLSDRIQVIPNGTPALPFQKRQFAPEVRWRVGMIGSIQPEKGQLRLLEAAASLFEILPNLEIVFCGMPGPGRSAYLKRVLESAPDSRVTFLGWRDDIGRVMEELDLLVIASEREGLPRVMLEAFSAGLPVLAFPVGGIAEAIHNNTTGLLVDDCSTQGLAGRIVDLATRDRNLLSTVATNARRQWEQLYNVNAFRHRIMGAIERVACGNISQPIGR